MLGQWCAAGLQYRDFWSLTFAEIMVILEGDYKRRMREHDDARVRNYELANWISYAHHEPNKMPKFQATPDRDKEASDAVAQEKVRGFFIGLALSSGKSQRS